MASKAIQRAAGRTTPTMKGLTSPTSILKRPPPLVLSPNPFPFATSATVVVSPSLKSPHVHFPPSASLTSTFATHSPDSYDRTAIIVSPNFLELPGRGDRVYSPTLEASGSHDKVLTSPLEDGPFQGDIGLDPPRRSKRRSILRQLDVPQRSPVNLAKALKTYPRSPYPTANFIGLDVDAEDSDAGAPRPQRSSSVCGVVTLFDTGKRGRKEPRSPSSTSLLSSPLDGEFILSQPSTSLRQEFWQSVSLSEEQGHDVASTPRASELPFVFATQDGQLWSPGIPRHGDHLITTPTVTDNKALSRVMSPKPDDPFAAFPSFSSVLLSSGANGGVITYPPPVITVSEKRPRALANE
ncbi:uncharacterized protein BT62DRAFT_1071097 [Guyanagaster necrorhizus]|uniref:Uncharacterized protein n=1 Tax=Guyanagaster necrorhizus TaxID=856835 RepID=A0A9P7W3C7_9AGAR|nr:uncharacterized protein BT62DRAFT_1071097 [Guyanagaster necrorhizus MCA 3950]KAG7451892.1 hypothetical protein BT62DRAFT_1071097 [Guyanagaster necrorhizus MCA 3950]